ncbi:ATP-binding protein [Streptomyces sp. NBC_00370]|uniref:ATP-binding protein n=1 Tax=Streptomyces sp. NBC_00370 TaxID=2975728 RepID=UPI002E26F76E
MEQIEVATPGGTATGPSGEANIALDGEPGMIATARRFTADFLARFRDGPGPPLSSRLSGVAELVVSELVTNSCKYAPGPCLLELKLDDSVLEVTVWDSDSTLPLAYAAEPGRIGQHGMEIVLALCEGYDVQREPVGKRIRVRISVNDSQRDDSAECR